MPDPDVPPTDTPGQAQHQPSALMYVTGDFTIARSGSHARFDQMLRFLLGGFDRVVVYAYSNNATNPWTEEARARFRTLYPRAALVTDVQTRTLRLAHRLKNLLLMAAPERCEAIVGWRLKGAAPNYEAIVAELGRPALLINFADGVLELNGVAMGDAVIETHDSKFVRYAKVRGLPVSSWKALSRLRAEHALISRARASVAISRSEAGFFQMLSPRGPVFYVPTYDDPAPVVPATQAGAQTAAQAHDLLFVGSNNSYNVGGLADFLEANADWLGGYAITVAGGVCDDARIRGLAGRLPRLQLLGYVDDLTALYAASKLVISPVDGTGLNLKVVDALAHGKAVAASTHALLSLPFGYEACVFPIDRGQVERLVGDPEARREAEAQARAYYNGAAMRGDRDALGALLQTPL